MDRQGQDNDVLRNTLRKDTSRSEEEALMKVYGLLRPGDPPTVDAARNLLHRLLFSPKRYDLGRVGRYKLNQRLGLEIPIDVTILTKSDFVEIIRYLLVFKDNNGFTDDIDHLGNRRVRSVGELLANQFSIGLTRMARIIKERMSLQDNELMTPSDLVNARTVAAVIKTFFGSSQLSQFMDQTNPLAELTHKRRLSALGPGGLTRERAGFEVRDVHYTHYGRVCPIETPGRPEHRADKFTVDLRKDKRVRVPRDPVPEGPQRDRHRRRGLPDRGQGRPVRGRPGQRARRQPRQAARRRRCSPRSRATSRWSTPSVLITWTFRPSRSSARRRP